MILEIIILTLLNQANYTLPTNVSNIGQFFGWANTTVNNLFGMGLSIAIFLIILLGSIFRGTDPLIGFEIGSFISLLVSLILLLMNLIQANVVLLYSGFTVLGFLLLLLRGVSSPY
ncbi:MAG: hypothetical protein ACP5JY_02750 [Candidatus Nanoarchaeia archaeon]|jgi:hypothetical protein